MCWARKHGNDDNKYPRETRSTIYMEIVDGEIDYEAVCEEMDAG